MAIKSYTVILSTVSSDLRMDLGEVDSPTCAAAWRPAAWSTCHRLNKSDVDAQELQYRRAIPTT